MSVSGLIPSYNIIKIDLSDTDGQDSGGRLFSQQTGFICATFRDTHGNPVNNRYIEITLGDGRNDRIPVYYNNTIKCNVPIFVNNQPLRYQTVDKFRAFWPNTPGVFCYLAVAQNIDDFFNNANNPVQSITKAVGSIALQARKSIGAAATLISAANPSILCRHFYNESAANIYIGASNVTVANGFTIPPATSYKLEHNNTDIYGIVAAGSSVLKLLTESL